MKYLVHIRAPEEMDKKFVAMRLFMRSDVVTFERNVPHCTLFVTCLDHYDEKAMIHSLEGVSSLPIRMELGEFNLFDGNNLVVGVSHNDNLRNLHYRVMEAGIGHTDISQRPEIPEQYADDMERRVAHASFGSPYFGKFYRPHLTIAEINPSMFPTVVEKYETMFRGLSWEATEFWLSRKAEQWEMVKNFKM